MASATNTALTVAAVTAAACYYVIPAYYCWAKGKVGVAITALLFVPLVGIIGAWRLAKPDSRYALKNYGRTKMAEATARYPSRAANVPTDWVPNYDGLDEPAPPNEQDSDWSETDVDPSQLDPITRRALRRSGRLP